MPYVVNAHVQQFADEIAAAAQGIGLHDLKYGLEPAATASAARSCGGR